MADEKYKELFNLIVGKIDAAPSLETLKEILTEQTANIRDEGAKGFFHKAVKKASELNATENDKFEILNLIANTAKSDVLKEKCDTALELNQ